MSNSSNPQPFRRMCFVVTAYILLVYVSYNICEWSVADILPYELGAFIFISVMLLIINLFLLVIAIDEIVEYVKGNSRAA